ncbi:hypothetical protein E4U42_006299 [Claviceps africana]|uniref:Uncharacterized protein n=1 Tax=Claviceps africana TaxID=83212 RepID=A0A8K0NIY3_9HYPO|nr:hypothetical protein E4U42_006299 [Claviceps africana]
MASRSRISTPDPILSLQDRRRQNASSPLSCCCGSDDCVLLRRNYCVLQSVEKDAHTAAQLGQALLARHEAYMADAERERLDLNERIERLEMEKHDLEFENASKIEENRGLLEQLEALNNSLSDSDVKIRTLESSLFSTQQAVRRLEAAAGRAEDAERHLAVLEEQTDKLLMELRASKDDARTQIQRYKEAQRGILDMQDQLERIENEARRERQNHIETIERLERQREIEKQLDAAAGRLKGAAATKSLRDHKNGSKIIGHFVRDLLQDNANLQLGISELREMLLSSNDEIQSLRDQLVQHQPLMDGSASAASTLRAELEPRLDRPPLSQDLHIHHHYHVATKHEHRRPKKKRQGLLPGIQTPSTTSNLSRRQSGQWGLASSPTAPALLCRLSGGEHSRTASRTRNIWDETSQTASDLSSSVPSSPPTHHHRIFDASYNESDSVASSTTSFDPQSPAWHPCHINRQSISSTHSAQSLGMSVLDHTPDSPSPKGARVIHTTYAGNIIAEEDEDDQSLPPLGQLSRPKLTIENSTSINEEPPKEPLSYLDEAAPRRRLPRVSSHESIMSLAGGLDIHTLKSRPSQMTLRPLGGADVVVTGVIARPTLSRSTAKHSNAALRDNFARFQASRSVSPLGVARISSSPCQSTPGTLGKLVGWRPWAADESTSSPQTKPASATASDVDICKDGDLHRVPGVNQPGPIPGFSQYWSSQKRKGAPAKVTTDKIDRDALTEILQE